MNPSLSLFLKIRFEIITKNSIDTYSRVVKLGKEALQYLLVLGFLKEGHQKLWRTKRLQWFTKLGPLEIFTTEALFKENNKKRKLRRTGVRNSYKLYKGLENLKRNNTIYIKGKWDEWEEINMQHWKKLAPEGSCLASSLFSLAVHCATSLKSIMYVFIVMQMTQICTSLLKQMMLQL